MPYYRFDVVAHYRTDEIYAETEEEAREIANDEYCPNCGAKMDGKGEGE